MARGDTEAMLVSYEPDAEIWIYGLEGVGIDRFYRGPEIGTMMGDMDEAFGRWSWTPRELVDGGDRIAIRANFEAHGRLSGVRTTIVDGGTAIKLSRRGKVAWQEWYGEADGWTKALAAVGLSAVEPS
jgi:hypothetical protein